MGRVKQRKLTQSEGQMLCYKMGDLLMNRQQISVSGVRRLCVRSVWVIQIKVTAIEVTKSNQTARRQNTQWLIWAEQIHSNTHTSHSVTP